MSPNGHPRLAFADLALIRGDRLLFSGLGLSLGAGDAALVSGPNGSGKSSLIRAAAGLLKPSAGRIDRVGSLALAQEALSFDLARPLGRALEYWAMIDGCDRRNVADAMAAMDLDRLAEVPVRYLSTGQRRRAVIARVIASGADIWLLDEPGNGLDAASLDLLSIAIARHRARGGIVLAATHQPLEIASPHRIELADLLMPA